MKKLMMAVGVVALAATVNAAAYNWAFDAEGNSPFGGATYYAFNTSIESYVSALSTTGYSAFSTAVAGLVSGERGDYVKGTLDSKGAASGAFTSAGDTFGVIVLTDDKPGSTFYYMSDSTSGYTYTPPNTPPGTLELWAFNESGNLDMSTGTVANVPEPTSGLLLLLGMAGLALKRKRA